MRRTWLFLMMSSCMEYDMHSIDQDASFFDKVRRPDAAIDDEGLDTGESSGTPDDPSQPDDEPGAEPETDPSDESDEDWDDVESDTGFDMEEEDDPDPDDPDPDDPDDDAPPDPDPAPGETASTARLPSIGEMVITELMIHPRAVDDAVGEWVEIENTTSAWIDLSGHRLGDGGVDDTEIDAVAADSLRIAPDGLAVICVEAEFWDNGGVDCDGTVRYWTFGGGFAMSNTEDEVILRSPGGTVLDEVRWGEGFSVEGSSLGLRADAHSASANDSLSNWCTQWSWLPMGDVGTPGEDNDSCW